MKPKHLTDEEYAKRGGLSTNYVYTPAPPIASDFQQNYRDVVELLQQKLLNFLRLNDKLRRNVVNRKRFIENTFESISFNFSEFKEAYKAKFLDPDFEKYCEGFIELFRPLLLDFLKEIQFGGYAFTFEIRYQGRKFEKTISVLNKDETAEL